MLVKNRFTFLINLFFMIFLPFFLENYSFLVREYHSFDHTKYIRNEATKRIVVLTKPELYEKKITQ